MHLRLSLKPVRASSLATSRATSMSQPCSSSTKGRCCRFILAQQSPGANLRTRSGPRVDRVRGTNVLCLRAGPARAGARPRLVHGAPKEEQHQAQQDVERVVEQRQELVEAQHHHGQHGPRGRHAAGRRTVCVLSRLRLRAAPRRALLGRRQSAARVTSTLLGSHTPRAPRRAPRQAWGCADMRGPVCHTANHPGKTSATAHAEDALQMYIDACGRACCTA